MSYVMQATDHRFQSIQDARAYALAGNALITLQSLKTGSHFTYKIQAPKTKTERGGLVIDYDAGKLFVKVLASGSADEGQFTYLGMITGGKFSLTKGSRVGVDAPSVKAFQYFLTVSNLEKLSVLHHNTCGRCGRTLTHPESIALGIGPECAGKL